jgi:ureidoglycolate lyase
MSMDRRALPQAESPVLRPRSLNAGEFSSFGDVLAPDGDHATPVNDGRALRYDGIADLSHVTGADVPVLSLYRISASALPFRADVFERHPLSSQVFLPLSAGEFLVVVAPDRGGEPDIAAAAAFVAPPGTGVHYRSGTWHVPLVALWQAATFAMLMWEAGPTDTIEHRLGIPLTIAL